MLLKIIAFLSAAVPVYLFVRSLRGNRPSRFSHGLKEFQKQIDLAVWIFIGLVSCVVAAAAGKLVWTWWTQL
jgi:multisubunit Na+/H+ antiporter MnhB subunit